MKMSKSVMERTNKERETSSVKSELKVKTKCLLVTDNQEREIENKSFKT